MLNDTQILKLNSAPGILLIVKHILFKLRIVFLSKTKNKWTIIHQLSIFSAKLWKQNVLFFTKITFIKFPPLNGNAVPHSTAWIRHRKIWKPILFLIRGRNRKKLMHNILLHSFGKQYSHLKVIRHQQWFTLPDNTTPLCRTSSIFWTIILCTSCNSVLRAERLRRARESVNTFLAFWMYVSEKLCTY
jgi:hypothetical protein